MSTKYQIRDVREQILVDLKDAYPTKFSAYERSTVLGEKVFGDPKPHSNAVLNLFIQCGVAFALPYAYYMASRRGIPSLTNSSPGESLPPSVLAIAIKGLGELKAAELKAAKAIIFGRKTHKCDWLSCYSSSSVFAEKNSDKVFQTLLESIICSSGDMATNVLEAPELNSLKLTFCPSCQKAWLDSHRKAREEIWASLLAIFELRA